MITNISYYPVLHHICIVVNTSHFLICVFLCIYITYTPLWPLHALPWGRLRAPIGTCTRMVRALCTGTHTTHKEYSTITITYSDVTTVIQSVAFTYGARIRRLWASDVCEQDDAHIHPPIGMTYTSRASHARLPTHIRTLTHTES